MLAGAYCKICGSVRWFGEGFNKPDYVSELNVIIKHW